MPSFNDINFRYTDAEEEKLYSPELINSAFVDINSVLEQIRRPEKFIVVGPKGSGKTALAAKLTFIRDWNFFVGTDILEHFEYSLLKKTGGEKGVSIGGSVTTWQLLLLLRFTPILLEDERFENENPHIRRLANALQKYGLQESDNILSVVQYTSRRGIFGKLKSAFGEAGYERVNEENFKIKDPAALLSSVKDVFSKVTPTESTYYLVLDGLDYVLREGRNNVGYIADLINAIRQLNMFFSEIGLNAKCIVLIRNEVLQILPDPNLTKRANDNGVELKWYDNVRSPFETSLLEIIHRRAKIAGFQDDIKKLWTDWFPSEIHYKTSFEFVIVNTRYLPRDLISFFREVQKIGKEPPFDRVDVLSALNNYSDWFLQELSDALVGMIKESIRTELPNIIAELGREFTLSELRSKLVEHGLLSEEDSAELVAREMFNASWIGNKWTTKEGTPRYSWRHRKINAKLNLNHGFIVHSGLWKSLNLV